MVVSLLLYLVVASAGLIGVGGFYGWVVLLGTTFVLFNLSGLMGFSSPIMSLGLVLLLGFCLWLWGFICHLWEGGWVKTLASFCMGGLGGGLSVVLPSLELVSVVLRPLTLAFRIFINVVSGHVLLLIGGLASGLYFSVYLFLALVCFMEVFVSVVQPLILAGLVVLYEGA